MRTEPKIRFKEFTDAWEQHKLGEVADVMLGTVHMTRLSILMTVIRY